MREKEKRRDQINNYTMTKIRPTCFGHLDIGIFCNLACLANFCPAYSMPFVPYVYAF